MFPIVSLTSILETRCQLSKKTLVSFCLQISQVFLNHFFLLIKTPQTTETEMLSFHAIFQQIKFIDFRCLFVWGKIVLECHGDCSETIPCSDKPFYFPRVQRKCVCRVLPSVLLFSFNFLWYTLFSLSSFM